MRRLLEQTDVSPSRLRDHEVIEALAAASLNRVDPYLANVLATEAMNRIHKARLLLAHMAEGVCGLDADGRVDCMNPAAEASTGWREPAAKGLDACLLLHPSSAGERGHDDRCPIRRALATGKTIAVDEPEPFERRDGSAFPAAFTVAPVVHEGDVNGAVIAFRDVTESERAKARVLRERERLRLLVAASSEGIFLHEDGIVREASPALLAMFRVAREEAVGRHIFEFVHADSLDVAERALGEASPAYRVRCLRRDGSTFEADVRALTIPHEGRTAHLGILREAAPDAR